MANAALRLLPLVLIAAAVTSCAFIPRRVDVASVEARVLYPRDRYTPLHHVNFGLFGDRRVNLDRLGVGRNKLMMATTTIGISGDIRKLLERVVRQNFAAAGIGEGPSSLTVKAAVLEASTDAVGPDHVYVQVVASLDIVDSRTNTPILHRRLSGRQVTPVTQVSNLAWEDAFAGAVNQISQQVHEIAAAAASAITLVGREPARVSASPAGLSGTYTGEITGNTEGRMFKMQVSFTIVQSGNQIAGAWTTTGGTSGTVTVVLTENGIHELRARQVNPCAGDFGGVAVIEGANSLRGSYVGSDCNGRLTAAFVVTRQSP